MAAPNHLHAPIAIAALEAGQHVLLEKPMANTLADCDRLIAAAERSTAQLSIGLQSRGTNVLWSFAITENISNFSNTPDVGVQLGIAYMPKAK